MFLNNLYHSLPTFLRRGIDDQRFRLGMPTMFGSLANLHRSGFKPGAILDVGAYEGKWTRDVKTIFPSVPVLMIEANPDKESALNRLRDTLGSSVSLERCLVGAVPQAAVTFYAMETGSSVMPEVSSVARTPIKLDMQTLDGIVPRAGLRGPMLVKLDVQGYELDVLRGAQSTLEQTEVLVLELSLLEYNRGAPLLAQVIAEVTALGYAMYDICGLHRRGARNVLLQVDAVFVRESSTLRTAEKF